MRLFGDEGKTCDDTADDDEPEDNTIPPSVVILLCHLSLLAHVYNWWINIFEKLLPLVKLLPRRAALRRAGQAKPPQR